MRKRVFVIAVLIALIICGQTLYAQGSLDAVSKKGKTLGACPLKHTDVQADISGFLSRVKVTQEFENNFTEPIEAVYIFPLPQDSAVDSMTLKVGTRIIKGKILKREEAKQAYETAKNQGQTAALLDQERPNIFTQAVANILPNEKITVEITFVETLKYDAGNYEFVFPTVVAPRYNPSQVVDATAITPTLTPKDVRAGHDISITVNLDAGVPIENIASKSHEIETTNLSANQAVIKLKDENEIPNRDFILRYDVTGKRIEDAILTHKDERGGYFSLILSPPENFGNKDVTPKEIVFVLDTSGSMSGFPIEKAKESMKLAIDSLRPFDTFNLITFAGDTRVLFDKPVSATVENIEKAQKFLETREGGGGTEMMTAIKAALEPSDNGNAVRIVCFMTDGEVGNDSEIIGEVQKHPNARVFAFGIGSSINRFLLDKISQEGRGEVEYVGLNDDGSAAAKRFHERIENPLLTDISIDYNGLPVADVYPKKIPDLFSAKPVIINGRFTKAANGTIKLKGKIAGQNFEREIKVDLPENEPRNEVLATLWARTKIDDLTSQSYNYSNENDEYISQPNLKMRQTIASIGLKYNLLTQFTSFVAVEEKTVNRNGASRKINVPVEVPRGINREMVVEDEEKSTNRPQGAFKIGVANTDPSMNLPLGLGNGRAQGSGITIPTKSSTTASVTKTESIIRTDESPALPLMSKPKPSGTISGGVVNGKARNLVTPQYPTAAKTARTSGQVSVQVLIDESGKVISATAVSGNPLLRALSAQAARASTFSPTMLSGQAVKVSGTIVYSLTPYGKFTAVLLPNVQTENIETPKVEEKLLTLEQQKLNSLKSKLKSTPKISVYYSSVIKGQARNLVTPQYPLQANAVHASGEVSVQVLIDESGKIISANAISGNPSLRASAEQAARASSFSRTMLNGQPLKVIRTIVYSFTADGGNPTIVVNPSMSFPDAQQVENETLTPEQQKLNLFKSKLNPQIFALVERLQKANSTANADESKFVRNGKAEIIVQLTANNAETLNELKNLGFEFDNQASNFIVGRIALEKLTALAESNSVKFIAPNF